MRIVIILVLLVFSGLAMVILPERPATRIHGVSLVNPPRPIEAATMGEVKRVNARWVALIPYAFSREGEPRVSFDHSHQWWGEHSAGNCTLIQYAHDHGLKVMVKPHVWAQGAGWVGDFTLSTEADWELWEADYTRYIMKHAAKADSMQVEMLCIGTEFRIPAKERPQFWRSLIGQVREVYSGQITYASNWDNYENITWWDAVDYIGIDAYFPLADGDHPSIEQIKAGWEPIKKSLAVFSKKWDKPILFTEYGFQSVNGAAGRHWEVNKSEANVNQQLQADAYEATFQAFENENWWAGGFFWKWHFTTRHWGMRGTEWTPQGKPAEEVIARWYGKD
ncbi:MAG: hypothetical protein RLN88_08715 [Ekhidna sp.]|uniref:glycoside hydrolase family 113 n=1 Tax=Ekhidna sp. TaxID=2608089 RepID=UPI0032EE65CA